MSSEQSDDELVVSEHTNETRDTTDHEKKRKCCSRRCTLLVIALIVCIICSIFTIGFGVTYHLREQLLFFVVNKELSLTSGSILTPVWEKLGPRNSTVYYFNITNPYQVQHEGAKPNLVEVGPFVYMKTVVNDNLYWNEDETLLAYRRRISYSDNVPASVADPNNVTVTSLNVPLIGLLQLLENIETNPKYREWKIVFETIFETADWINELLHYEPLFITKTIDELSWGYVDPLFKLIHDLDPSLLPKANFSLRSRHKEYSNNSIYTGKNDSKLREQFYIWNGLSEIPEWNSPTARMINGTDATFFHTNISRSERMTAFTDDFQRSAYFTYDSDELIHGIESYRFVFSKDQINTTIMDPGFYPDGPSGVLNLSAVEPFGLPLFVSKPHFLDADQQFIDNVTGLHPNRTKHDSFLNIEPITGTTIKAAKRIQVNVDLKQRKQFMQLKNLQQLTMLPLFYVIDSGSIDDDQATRLHDILGYIEGGLNIGLPVLTGVAGFVSLLLLVCQVVTIARWRRHATVHKERRNTLTEQTPLLQ